MEINFREYINEEEMKEIIKDEVRIKIRQEFSREENFKRILTNSLYEQVSYEIISLENNGQIEPLKEQVKKIIEELSAYNVFGNDTTDRYNPKLSDNRILLNEIVKENRDELSKVVKRQLNYAYKEYNARNDMADIMAEAVYDLFSIRKEEMEEWRSKQ